MLPVPERKCWIRSPKITTTIWTRMKIQRSTLQENMELSWVLILMHHYPSNIVDDSSSLVSFMHCKVVSSQDTGRIAQLTPLAIQPTSKYLLKQTSHDPVTSLLGCCLVAVRRLETARCASCTLRTTGWVSKLPHDNRHHELDHDIACRPIHP